MSTVTNISGVSNIGPEMYMAVYSVALGTTSAAGLDAIDISGDFDYVHACFTAGNDTAADNAYSIACIHPGVTTAVTSTNVNLEVRNISDGATVDSTDLSAIGALLVVVIGRQAL